MTMPLVVGYQVLIVLAVVIDQASGAGKTLGYCWARVLKHNTNLTPSGHQT